MEEKTQLDKHTVIALSALFLGIVLIILSFPNRSLSILNTIETPIVEVNTSIDNPKAEEIFVPYLGAGVFLVLSSIAYYIAFKMPPKRKPTRKKSKKG